jgi:hypothetical protein
MDGHTTGGASAAAALALGLGIACAGPAPGAGAQEQRQQQEEVASCRVQRGDRHVHEEGSAAVGRTTLGACARAIRAGSGSGAWGPYEVEVDPDGRVRVNGEEVGVLRGPPGDAPAEGGGPKRG